MYTFDDILNIVNQEIDNINWHRIPYGLYEPIGYILSLGGKRLRPGIVLMSCNLYSEDIKQAMKAAIGLEIFHNFTLLHDDIMDKADIRRGKPTVHKKWNENTAILSGDVMQIEAYKWMAEVEEDKIKRTLQIFSKTAAEICEGQQFDMEFESRNKVSEEEYIEMIRLKTAVLIAAGCQIGALIGGASEKDARFLYNFGNDIGLAFQLKDDLLDVYGDEKTFGKKIGGDILCNKKTFLLIRALELAEGKHSDDLRYWLSKNNDDDKKIDAITEVFNQLNVKEYTEMKMEYYYNRAIDNLNAVSISSDKKQELIKLARYLMKRID